MQTALFLCCKITCKITFLKFRVERISMKYNFMKCPQWYLWFSFAFAKLRECRRWATFDGNVCEEIYFGTSAKNSKLWSVLFHINEFALLLRTQWCHYFLEDNWRAINCVCQFSLRSYLPDANFWFSIRSADWEAFSPTCWDWMLILSRFDS